MLLIDAAPVELNSIIVFDVTLGDGARPIKAEARVTGRVEPAHGRPGGLRVRFKRYGAPTKAFIERAVALAKLAEVTAASSADAAPPPEPSSPEASAPEVVGSAAEHAIPPEAAGAPGHDEREPARTDSFHPAPVAAGDTTDVASALAALRGRGDPAVEVPAQREALLERLRQRGVAEDVTMRYERG